MYRRCKFNNRITYVGEERFDSKLEANHYLILKQLEKKGDISFLVRQPPYKIYITNFKTNRHAFCCTYKADFTFYDNRSHKDRVIDSKGLDTAYSKLKRKMVLIQHDIKVELWTNKTKLF